MLYSTTNDVRQKYGADLQCQCFVCLLKNDHHRRLRLRSGFASLVSCQSS